MFSSFRGSIPMRRTSHFVCQTGTGRGRVRHDVCPCWHPICLEVDGKIDAVLANSPRGAPRCIFGCDNGRINGIHHGPPFVEVNSMKRSALALLATGLLVLVGCETKSPPGGPGAARTDSKPRVGTPENTF